MKLTPTERRELLVLLRPRLLERAKRDRLVEQSIRMTEINKARAKH